MVADLPGPVSKDYIFENSEMTWEVNYGPTALGLKIDGATSNSISGEYGDFKIRGRKLF